MKKPAPKTPQADSAKDESVAMDRITIRMPKTTEAKLRQLAGHEDRPLTAYIRRVLTRHVHLEGKK